MLLTTSRAMLSSATRPAFVAPDGGTRRTVRVTPAGMLVLIWAVTTNQSGAKISASIPTAMPTGLTLSVNLAAPSGATSAGLTPLGTVAVDLVSTITKVAQLGMTATYELTATAAAGVVASSTKVVTYTISGGT